MQFSSTFAFAGLGSKKVSLDTAKLVMELPLQTLALASQPKAGKVIRNSKFKVGETAGVTLLRQRSKISMQTSALPETLASVAIAATLVGAAATLLIQRTKTSYKVEISSIPCEDCSGSGICPACKGEGFVSKRLSKETAERARTTAKTAATRYTAGLPKKWSYCTKCSSSRSCITCGGSGRIIVNS